MLAQWQHLPYYPFTNVRQNQLAQSLTTPRLEANQTIHNIAVLGQDRFLSENAGFQSVAQFHSCLDEMASVMTPWQSILIKGDDNLPEQEPVRYWLRDSLAVLQEILENPELIDHCVWGPVRQRNSEGERVYTDMHTGDWWWKVQVF